MLNIMPRAMRRWTWQYSFVLGIIYDADDFLSAEQVHYLLKKKDGNIGIATVYRNLRKMVSQGLISEVVWKSVKHYTKHPFSNAFFVCERCGKMLRIDIPITDQDDLSKETGLNIIRWSMRFEGICEECERCT